MGAEKLTFSIHWAVFTAKEYLIRQFIILVVADWHARISCLVPKVLDEVFPGLLKTESQIGMRIPANRFLRKVPLM